MGFSLIARAAVAVSIVCASTVASAESSPDTRVEPSAPDHKPAPAIPDEQRRRAATIIRHMLAPQSVEAMENTAPSAQFGSEFARLAYENAYVSLWARPGLTLKERSILTIGILIGVGNEKELRSHVAAGLRNGLTRAELEEIIYHATAYAGFPAASSAMSVASSVVDQPRK